jgi:hypothetical protein
LLCKLEALHRGKIDQSDDVEILKI